MKSEMKRGFTLIEVTFSLLLMTLGLFAVFHLFPSGLRASVDANAFTRQSMFAEDCFGAIRAAAAEEWSLVFPPDGLQVTLSDGTPLELDRDWSDGSFVYPAGQDGLDGGGNEYLRCKLTLAQDAFMGGSHTNLGSVKLEVRFGRVGTLGDTFYTEVYDYRM
ncbi:MAG: type II secretion system protein [Verrucomicrobia bacterium]|jgi:type II secretory pathway pseudopilin PulG|nr:type II secretion system protein [Verrucomicrobiota bacterium]